MSTRLKNKLNDAIIKNTKAEEKDLKLFDGNGLYLLCKPNGAKYWRFKYRFAGKEKQLALGVYPEIPLKKARQSVMEARDLLRDFQDPCEVRKAKKKNLNLNTFLVDEQEAILEQRQLALYREIAKFVQQNIEKFNYDSRLIQMISEAIKN